MDQINRCLAFMFLLEFQLQHPDRQLLLFTPLVRICSGCCGSVPFVSVCTPTASSCSLRRWWVLHVCIDTVCFHCVGWLHPGRQRACQCTQFGCFRGERICATKRTGGSQRQLASCVIQPPQDPSVVGDAKEQVAAKYGQLPDDLVKVRAVFSSFIFWSMF